MTARKLIVLAKLAILVAAGPTTLALAATPARRRPPGAVAGAAPLSPTAARRALHGGLRLRHRHRFTGPRACAAGNGNRVFTIGVWPTGCWRPYGPSSPFNERLPAHPQLLPNSAAIVRRTLAYGPPSNLVAGVAGTSSDYGHPVYYSRPSDPVYTIRCTEPWGQCAIDGMRVRIPGAAAPAAGSDRHMAVVDQANGWEYDFWQVQSKPAGGGELRIGWGGRTRLAGNGLGSDATAAHFGLQAGIIRAQELQAGQIDHALFMVVKCTTGGYVFPAHGGGSACGDRTDAPAGGMRFQLDYSDAQIDALHVPTWKKTILRALANYGAFVGDTGGSGMNFQLQSGSTYTSFGYPDAMVQYARSQPGVVAWDGRYVFNLASGVDWSRLRVIAPCVTAHTCG
ncbi:MAG: hypothetical protein ACYCXW_17090 [Solirubrobacteraceae bacterium]